MKGYIYKTRFKKTSKKEATYFSDNLRTEVVGQRDEQPGEGEQREHGRVPVPHDEVDQRHTPENKNHHMKKISHQSFRQLFCSTNPFLTESNLARFCQNLPWSNSDWIFKCANILAMYILEYYTVGHLNKQRTLQTRTSSFLLLSQTVLIKLVLLKAAQPGIHPLKNGKQ